MRVPLSWLKDFAPFPDDVELLRASLDDLGLVVEGIEATGAGLDDVVVARIDDISSIEGADRIRKVIVDAGDGPVEIVCGATNFSLGDLVPLAPVGAVLPGNFEIARRKMKGVVSNGMLCSGRELGLGDDHQGLMLLTELAGIEPGQRLIDALNIEPDTIFDITVEGNRPDAHSISGIARDLAARLGLAFTPCVPSPPRASGPATAELVTGEVVDPSLCPRLALGVATNVTVTESPRWIQERLEKAGMRPINNVVDASNYVMLELGQPTHPYDMAQVAGPGLRVRRAAPGEKVTTLDGVERILGIGGKSIGDTGEDCIICDAADQPIGIAGIMGGASSEIGATTSTVLLEAASFNPIALTRTSRRLAHRTEASMRFQKGTDPALLETVIDRFFELVALSSPELVVAPHPLVIPEAAPVPLVIELPLARVESLLGVAIDGGEVARLLGPLGFVVDDLGGETVRVHVPTSRPDVRSAPYGIADVIEEIARIYGYSRIPRRTLAWSAPGARNPKAQMRTSSRAALLGLGASEAWTSSLVGEGELAVLGIDEPEIAVANPLSSEESRLRRSLLPGLVRAVGYNADRRLEPLALFEIGQVFFHPSVPGHARTSRAGGGGEVSEALPDEREMAVALFARPSDDARTAVAALTAILDALDIDRVVLRATTDESDALAGLHPTRRAVVLDATSGALLGSVGEVDPLLASRLAPGLGERRIAVVQLDLDALRDPTRTTRRSPVARPVSRFPSADLDLAFSVPDSIPVDEVLNALHSGGGELVERAALFDVYRGPGVAEGTRSLAFSIRLCAQDRTLSDEEIGATRASMIEAATALGAVLR
jgi:phenylalanyl-tRNA synthetase beta chain